MEKEFIHTMKLPLAVLILVACQLQLMAQQPRPVPTPYATGTKVNFVRSWDAMAPEQDPNALTGRPLKDVKQTTQYLDGLGRPLQTVIKEGSMATGAAAKDMVSAVEYDALGREQYKYLPFAANTTGGYPANDGKFKMNPFQQQEACMNALYGSQNELYFYGKTNFEPNPLNRVSDSYAPGNSWVGSEASTTAAQRRNVQLKYYLNTATDAVRIWRVTNAAAYGQFGTYSFSLTTGATYAANELYKNIAIDEHKNQVIEFKDKEGKVILKKVQLTAAADDGSGSGYTGWLCTYYIYDDLNNLRCVIQPEGVKQLASDNWQQPLNAIQLAEQCFRYEYDARNRMIMKKVPGAGEVYMVYDSKDRLVMTQDANMRQGTAKWMVTKYDEINRPIETGLWINSIPFVTHLSSANSSSSYPATSSGYELLTLAHFDDYNSLPSGLSSTYLNTWDGNFTSSSSWPYPQMPVQSNAVRGLLCWSKTKVIGSLHTYLNSVIVYDDKGKPIQAQTTNVTGGADVSTTQYSWAGQPLVTVQKQDKQGAPVQSHIVITKINYDDLGRLLEVKKTINSDIAGTAVNKAEQLIVSNQYDESGQLKNKKLAPAYGTNGLETLNYDYNIRGWMLGMNRSYLATTGQSGTTRFGFELAYDKTTGSNGRNFTAAQYNGNINGMVWKSDGDDVKRKYDFGYDPANRLLKGAFEQDDANASWNHTTMDYSMQMGNGSDPTAAYDYNGNIKGMTQYGWKLGVPSTTPIDNLTYTMESGTNRLKQVTDANNDYASKLGDFKYDPATKTATDYNYDVNGNLTLDNNKKISAISYNHLNLPSVISVDKGTITYIYDAAGNKMKKITIENPSTANNNKTITTTTTYLGGIVYESKTTAPANSPDDDYTDRLQFIAHEEGRIRYKAPVGSNPAKYEYDYFVKDHLGNVRMVLTEEAQQDAYPAATMEEALATAEETFYSNLPETRTSLPAGYPANSASGNAKVAKVNGTVFSEGNKIGPAIALKVMAGDKFNVQVNSWYKNNLQPDEGIPAPTGIITELIAALQNAVSGIAGVKANPTDLYNSGALLPGANTFISNQASSSNGNAPRAYLNWILFDEQFKLVSSSSGFDQVPEESYYNNGSIPNNNTKLHVWNDMPITKSGFLYIYVSNETPNIDVFFDNLQVTHVRGQILEETHYYPFGLTMAGISSKAAGSLENKRKWNAGSELNTDFDINLYETFYRSLDPQIGRFWQIDPKPSPNVSLYVAMDNNPMRFSDPLGDTVLIRHHKKDIIYNNGVLTNKDGSAYKGKVKGFLKQAVNSLNSGRTRGSAEAASLIAELQGSANNFTIVKGEINNFDPNTSQRFAAEANQLMTDPKRAQELAAIPPALLLGGAGGTLTWNPKGGDNVWVVGGAKDNNPTVNLLHELFHARDANRGLWDLNYDNGIRRNEWQASYKENTVRQQMGLPLREYYREQNAGGVVTPLAPKLLDATNNPIRPTWVPTGW